MFSIWILLFPNHFSHILNGINFFKHHFKVKKLASDLFSSSSFSRGGQWKDLNSLENKQNIKPRDVQAAWMYSEAPPSYSHQLVLLTF